MKLYSKITMAAISLISLSGFAQTNQTVAPLPTSPSAPKTHSLVLGLKSTIDSGRPVQMINEGSRKAKFKNEMQMGYKHISGWGAYGNVVQTYDSIRATKSKTSTWKYGDPSLTVTHPDFYKGSDTTVGGQLRYYFPTTLDSVAKNLRLYTYYLRSNTQLGNGQEIFNEFTPRYFQQNAYKSDDTTYYLEDTTIYSKRLNKEWKVGARQWTQYAIHPGVSPGLSIELGPQAVYSINSNFSVTPSVMLPVYTKGLVYDAPTAVSTDQIYMSVLLQARL